MKDTFNITIKCDTEENRDKVLDLVLQHPELASCQPKSNVFFSENEARHFTESERVVT
jgi:hypothetical protein